MGWIGRAWNPATVPALAGLFGSLVGACASTASAWIAQRYHERKDLLARTISYREQLYSDFIRESARAMVDAMQHTLEDPSRLTPVLRAHQSHAFELANERGRECRTRR